MNDGFTIYTKNDTVLVGLPAETEHTFSHTGVAEPYAFTCPGGDYRHVNASAEGASVGVDICNLCGMSHASGTDIGTGTTVGDGYIDVKGQHKVNGYRCTICGKTWCSITEITKEHLGTSYTYKCTDYGYGFTSFNKCTGTYILYAHNLSIADGIACTVAVSRQSACPTDCKLLADTTPVAKYDYVAYGREIAYIFTGVSQQTDIIIRINGTEYTKPAGVTTFTFTMPDKPTTVSIAFSKQPQAIATFADTYSKTYNSQPFNLGTSIS